ncbi:MAG: HAMP domain-containing protein, partial [Betaproteobacteria bacterium]
MPMNFHRLLPSSLFSRMAIILLVGLLTAQLASLWLQWGERATVVSQARGQNFAERMVEAIRSLEAVEPAKRGATLSALQSDDLQVKLITEDQVSPNLPRGSIQASISAKLGSEREVRSLGGPGGPGAGMMGMGMGFGPGVGAGAGAGAGTGMGMQRGNPMRSFDVRLRDGQWIRISAAREAEAPALPNELLGQLLITLMIVIAVVMIAVRLATKPLHQLAQAADTLGSDLSAPPLAEIGPAETRRAAQAFNRMQARIKRL